MFSCYGFKSGIFCSLIEGFGYSTGFWMDGLVSSFSVILISYPMSDPGCTP